MIKTYEPTKELNTTVKLLLRESDERLNLLARIAFMGVEGYLTQTVTNKGQVVDIIKHDLSSSIRAVQTINKMVESKATTDGAEFNLVINSTPPLS